MEIISGFSIFFNIIFISLLFLVYRSGYFKAKGSLQQRSIPTKPRSRSVPDVAVLNSRRVTAPLIKYQRLPRGFFWNTSLPSLVYSLSQFIKSESHYDNRIKRLNDAFLGKIKKRTLLLAPDIVVPSSNPSTVLYPNSRLFSSNENEKIPFRYPSTIFHSSSDLYFLYIKYPLSRF